MPKVEIHEGVVFVDTSGIPNKEVVQSANVAYPVAVGEVPELPYHKSGIGAVRASKTAYQGPADSSENIIPEKVRKIISSQI
jgi:hypothetical protein